MMRNARDFSCDADGDETDDIHDQHCADDADHVDHGLM